MFIRAAPVLIFTSALLFSLGIMINWPHHAVLSFSYNLVMLGVVATLIASLPHQQLQVGSGYVVLLAICNHVGVLIGFSLADGADTLLWPADAVDHHLPNAIAFSEWVSGKGDIVFFGDNPFSKLYVSNMWVGLFFSVLGIYPVVSAIAMLLIKSLTIILIHRTVLVITKRNWVAVTAALIYGLIPTVTFYTIQFYKDYFIHFLVALLLYLFSRSLSRPIFAVLMAAPLAILFIERFYLLVIICAALTIYFWTLSGRLILKVSMLVLAGFTTYIVLGHYFEGQGLVELFETIQDFESVQNDSTDVTPTTNLALDLFRITFTPFFNAYKLNFYDGYDSILIFGGFIHGLVMLCYLRGLWVERKNRIVTINLAFLFLLIILALIMPYDGRARDSLYPMVSIFAAIGIASLFGVNTHRRAVQVRGVC